MKAAIVGGGVIGGGWAARFLLNGWDVAVCDPAPDAERKINEVIANARRSLPSLYDKPLPKEGSISYHSDLSEAVRNANWVQESVPERLDLKHNVLGQLTEIAPKDAIIGSSTSGFKPSDLTKNGAEAIVAHPFNPVYLLPLVELVGDPEKTAHASGILRNIGMFPLVLRKEIDAHIADRLLEAVWRESLWLVKDGVASTEEIDEAIRMAFGIRWAQMGLFETYRIAGGEAGMKHFMTQFGPALSWPWTKLTDVPEFNDELIDLIADQSDAQSGHMSIRELERLRDDNLVGMMRALKKSRTGAGVVINTHENSLSLPATDGLPITLDRQIPQSWTDYNGHMNEAHYVEASSAATDQFLELLGADATYVAAGKSYFTVENHIRYQKELHAGERLFITTQLLEGKGKKLRLYHSLYGRKNELAATIETLLLHVDLTTRKTCEPEPQIVSKMADFKNAQSVMSVSKDVGSRIGEL